MKMVIAVIQPTKLDAVQQALATARRNADDRLRRDGLRPAARPARDLPRPRVQDESAAQGGAGDRRERRFPRPHVECLEDVARTSAEGHIGDGKIFVVPMEQAIQISDGYRGKGAI